MTHGVLLLSRQQIAALMTLDEYIAAVEDAFRMHAEGKALKPGLLHVDAHDGEFHIKAGGLRLDRTYFGLKVNGGFFQNMARFGLPNIQGVIILANGENGTPLAIMDSIEITIQRTGATVAAAAKRFARPDTRVATICGCGNQGRAALTALCHVLPLQRAFAFDRDPQRAVDFARRLSATLGMAVQATDDLADAIGQSDVVATCTPARRFYLTKDMVRPGTFVAAVGADSPDKQELDPHLVATSTVVVDVLEQCATVGELHHALAAGLMRERDVHGELGAVISGRVAGRTSEAETIVFDTTGTALQDTAAAAVVYKKAVASGVGTLFSFFA